ncbi:MAG: cytidylate kinase-like family protein [Ardenticatenaceae bacterium]|nr:cytidylate kinase-like family protein [Ardenticatenaceae bacterium]
MTVITVSRELGSQGEAVARQVAVEMGYRFVAKTTIEKVLHQYGLIRLDDLYQSAPSLWARLDIANLELVSMLDKVILGIARLDHVVLLGRGGYAALSGYADVLNVRIQAPFATRVACIMDREGLDSSQAEKRVTRSDKARDMFVQGYYGADFNAARQFNLVLDSSVIPVETAVAWIKQSAQLLAARSSAGLPTTQEIVVDPVLADAINQVLTLD